MPVFDMIFLCIDVHLFRTTPPYIDCRFETRLNTGRIYSVRLCNRMGNVVFVLVREDGCGMKSSSHDIRHGSSATNGLKFGGMVSARSRFWLEPRAR